jgi:hypothetical protein
VLSELVSAQLGQKDLAGVFPGYRVGTPLGLLRVSRRSLSAATRGGASLPDRSDWGADR